MIVSETLAECKALRSQWVKLVESMAYPSPFVSPDWVLTALESNDEKWQAYFVQVRRANELVAILPLYRVKTSLIKELRYIGDCYYPDPLGLCCREEDRGECIKIIRDFFEHVKDWDVLHLRWLLNDEASKWQNNGTTVKKSSVAPFIHLSGTFQDYLSEYKKKINFVIRKVKKFDKQEGHYHFTQSAEKCKELLDWLFYLHNQRSSERGIKSSFSGSDIIAFHSSLIDICGDLYFHWLTLDDDIIAVLYGFIFQGRFFYYQISHDPKMGHLSPGAVLLYKAVEQCCEINIKEFNFLQGDEDYKWKWTKNSRDLYTVEMYNGTFAGRLSKYQDKLRSVVKCFMAKIRKKAA